MRLHLDWHIRVGAGVGVEGRGTVRRRRRRKDAGLKKESAASLLTGITGGKEAERLIMAGRGDEISLVTVKREPYNNGAEETSDENEIRPPSIVLPPAIVVSTFEISDTKSECDSDDNENKSF